MSAEKGQTAVVVPVLAVEPVVSAWRRRFDTSAAQGMPAHITALFPFLPERRLTGDVVARLRELCSELPVLDVQFSARRGSLKCSTSTRSPRTDCGNSPAPSLSSGPKRPHTAERSMRSFRISPWPTASAMACSTASKPDVRRVPCRSARGLRRRACTSSTAYSGAHERGWRFGFAAATGSDQDQWLVADTPETTPLYPGESSGNVCSYIVRTERWRRLDRPRGVVQSGSAPGWGPGGRRFKSCLPDLKLLLMALFLVKCNGLTGSKRALGVQFLRSSGNW